jgi:hypothetical protein
MALRAGQRRMSANEREHRGMIKGRRGKGRCVVAQSASCRESSGDVRGVSSASEVGLMARVAIGRNGRVVVVGMARGARNGCMRSGQGERRVVVVEYRTSPGSRRVARSACRRETRGGMIGIGCPGVVRLVARIAIRGNGFVVAIGVAGSARHGRMCTGQWEYRRMVKGRGRPCSRAVTKRTGRREAGRNVGGICRTGEVRLVAGVAIRWQACVVVIDVARSARNSGVGACKREWRVVVIEHGARP